MLVRNCMTPSPVSVRPESDPVAALGLLNAGGFRHLPVITDDGSLVGIVDRASLEVFLSRAGSPGVLRRQHRVDQAMISPVVTVTPDCPLEDAAALMIRQKITSLPVVESGRVVGIITETDIFKQFVAALSGSPSSIRVSVRLPDVPGQLAELAGRIARARGNITSVLAAPAEVTGWQNLTLRVEGVDRETLLATVSGLTGLVVLGVWDETCRAA